VSVISLIFVGRLCNAMDPNAQYVSFIVTSKAGHNSQPGLPKSFLLDVSSDSGEAALDSPAGKALLIEAKRKVMMFVFVVHLCNCNKTGFDRGGVCGAEHVEVPRNV
jgi:hypothetical protein